MRFLLRRVALQKRLMLPRSAHPCSSSYSSCSRLTCPRHTTTLLNLHTHYQIPADFKSHFMAVLSGEVSEALKDIDTMGVLLERFVQAHAQLLETGYARAMSWIPCMSLLLVCPGLCCDQIFRGIMQGPSSASCRTQTGVSTYGG